MSNEIITLQERIEQVVEEHGEEHSMFDIGFDILPGDFAARGERGD